MRFYIPLITIMAIRSNKSVTDATNSSPPSAVALSTAATAMNSSASIAAVEDCRNLPLQTLPL
jgi:hypothetical protein